MVILKLLPNQIARHWDVLSYAVAQTTVAGFEVTEEYLVDTAAKLISGQMQCWACYERDENKGLRIGAFIFTSIITDALTNTRNLLLAGVFVFDIKGIKVWQKGFSTLKEFGKVNDCRNIVFYTNIPDLVKLAKTFGALTEFTYGTISIT